ncbi:MAG: enoyl-CoA hydratase/isomerase family protein [Pyrinomonadaceae bacterium]|nr:enoyl-CoA hydratase/isomerase family protein [Pyrinomonadaceae bacterium]
MNEQVSGLSPELRVDARTAVIAFSRPAQRNRLSTDVLSRLRQVVEQVEIDSGVDSIVFTGSGSTFAAGADLKQVAALSRPEALEFGRFGQTVLGKVRRSRKLTIAAVNGFCMGGALDLAMSCDMRIAAEKAVFSHPGVSLGIITGWGGTQMLPSLVGLKNAYRILLTADRIEAQEALRIGLIDEISVDPLERSLEIAGGRI